MIKTKVLTVKGIDNEEILMVIKIIIVILTVPKNL